MFDRDLQYDFEAAVASVDGAKAAIRYLDKQFSLGSGKAGYVIAQLVAEPLMAGEGVREYYQSLNRSEATFLEMAFPKLHNEAFLGDGQAMHWIGLYYQSGCPPLGKTSMSMFAYWIGKARQAGLILDQY